MENIEKEPDDNIKRILYLPLTIDKKKENYKNVIEKPKRIVTTQNKWNFTENELLPEIQFDYIKEIREQLNSQECDIIITNSYSNTKKIIIQQINQKLYGYKCQDIQKGLFSESEFIDILFVIQKMIDCNNLCFYCKNPVYVLYEYVREPKQWTVERIDNNFGHNKSNIEIACLNCNLRRRTMYHERYVFTKQLNIQKI